MQVPIHDYIVQTLSVFKTIQDSRIDLPRQLVNLKDNQSNDAEIRDQTCSKIE